MRGQWEGRTHNRPMCPCQFHRSSTRCIWTSLVGILEVILWFLNSRKARWWRSVTDKVRGARGGRAKWNIMGGGKGAALGEKIVVTIIYNGVFPTMEEILVGTNTTQRWQTISKWKWWSAGPVESLHKVELATRKDTLIANIMHTFFISQRFSFGIIRFYWN